MAFIFFTHSSSTLHTSPLAIFSPTHVGPSVSQVNRLYEKLFPPLVWVPTYEHGVRRAEGCRLVCVNNYLSSKRMFLNWYEYGRPLVYCLILAASQVTSVTPWGRVVDAVRCRILFVFCVNKVNISFIWRHAKIHWLNAVTVYNTIIWFCHSLVLYSPTYTCFFQCVREIWTFFHFVLSGYLW